MECKENFYKSIISIDNDIENIFNTTFDNCKGHGKPVGAVLVQNDKEAQEFIKFVVKNIQWKQQIYFLEIGSRWGGSFVFWGNALKKYFPFVHGISLDMPGGQGEGKSKYTLEEWLKKIKCIFQYDLIIGDSHDKNNFEKIKNILGTNFFDMIFIDGDHSEEGSMKDFIMYSKLLNKGGIIGFHDIIEPKHWPWVQCYKTWEKIKKQHPNNTIKEWNYMKKQDGIGAIIL